MDYVDALYGSIEELVTRFQESPFDFRYERDLQAMLYALLYKKFGSEKISMRGGHRETSHYGGIDNVVRTVPVHCEYPSVRPFDIAIIDPATLRPYNSAEWQRKGLKNDAFWDQPVRAAVELKYCQLGNRPGHKHKQCKDDIGKLRLYREGRGAHPFLGISIIFVQSPAQDPAIFADAGTPLDESERPPCGLLQHIVWPNGWKRFSV